MPFRIRLTAVPFASALLLGACGSGSADAPSRDRTNAIAAANGATVETIEDPDALRPADQDAGTALPTDAWVGRWTGPEGLFLDIQPSPNGQTGHYALTNKDTLDRQGDYAGTAKGTTIQFRRDDKNLTIRPGSGAETGFKYLADKTDCLIIILNQEGYCR